TRPASSGSAATPARNEEASPLAQSSLTTTVAPAAETSGDTSSACAPRTTSTGSHPPERSTSTARSARVAPPLRSSALAPSPRRRPAPAASTRPTTCAGEPAPPSTLSMSAERRPPVRGATPTSHRPSAPAGCTGSNGPAHALTLAYRGDMTTTSGPTSTAAVSELLESTGYLTDEGLATITYLALAMGRPLLLEGEPGTGKTSLAEALAQGLGRPLIRLQCYEGIDASQALYDWDFTKQILHLRALEAAAVTRGARGAGGSAGTAAGPATGNGLATEEIEKSLFDERFLLDRPLLKALRNGPAVLLIDEIDRADDEFEAFLLEILSAWQVTIPELGTIRAQTPPVVVLTSNRTRELHDALKRRCL